jgi:tRNA-splicing endonuclease subunit Sen34
MVGGLPGFRQQDALHGLPLQLSPEEVTLAVDSGWVELYHDADPLTAAATATAEDARASGSGTVAVASLAQQRPRHLPAKGWGAKPKGHNVKRLKGSATEGGGRRGGRGGGMGGAAGGASAGGATEHSWEHMLQTSFVTLPLVEPQDTGPPSSHVPRGRDSAPRWTYPRTEDEKRRYAVFADLHRRGLTMTAGIKFGADYLAYPGDPMAYHACFTVRVNPLTLHCWFRNLAPLKLNPTYLSLNLKP